MSSDNLQISAETVTPSDPTLSALEDKLHAATIQRENAENEVNSAREDYADAIKQKQAIDKKIHALEVEVEALETLINNFEIKISLNNKAIASEEDMLDSQYAIVRERIRSKREDGSGDFLTILLESDGLTEFFTHIDRFMAMLDYDAMLLESYNNGIRELESLRVELEESKAELADQKKSLEDRRGELLSDLEDAARLVTEAESDIKNASANLERIQSIEATYEAQRKEKLSQLQASSNKGYIGGELLWPLPTQYTGISSGWGWRIHPVTGKQQFHSGIDIPAPYGTEIYAVNGGTVVECSYNYADGNYITISHGGGLASFYSHISRFRVSVGDVVERGQVIANVGTSGYTTGAHLNLNIYKDGNSVNPVNYFK